MFITKYQHTIDYHYLAHQHLIALAYCSDMKCILHIGTEKTGTSSIQSFLKANSKQLVREGILVPESLSVSGNHRLLPYLALPPCSGESIKVRKLVHDKYLPEDFKSSRTYVVDSLAKEIENSQAHTCIISSEHLSSRLRQRHQIEEIKDILSKVGFKEYTIIIYLRDQLSYALSEYSTYVLSGGSQRLCIEPTVRYDFLRLVQLWESVFHGTQFVVRTFWKEQFILGNLLQDFMQAALGSAPKYIDYTSHPVTNPSLDREGIELMLLINKYIPVFNENAPNQERSRIASAILKRFSNTNNRLRANKKEAFSLYEYYRTPNAMLDCLYETALDDLFQEFLATSYPEDEQSLD